MPRNTLSKQAKIISYMLHRKFEGVDFTVSVKKSFDKSKGFREISRRWIEVTHSSLASTKFHAKDIVYYLQRFQNGEEDHKGNHHSRSFWASKSGFATLALIRKHRRDGSTSIVERYEPLNKNQTELVRLEIQEYEVLEKETKPRATTFSNEEWDEFDE